MPIPVSELEEEKKPLKDRVYKWLAGHLGEAFKLAEIISGMTGDDPAAISLVLALASSDLGGAAAAKINEAYKPYARALDELRAEGRVESAELRGAVYFYARENKQ